MDELYNKEHNHEHESTLVWHTAQIGIWRWHVPTCYAPVHRRCTWNPHLVYMCVSYLLSTLRRPSSCLIPVIESAPHRAPLSSKALHLAIRYVQLVVFLGVYRPFISISQQSPGFTYVHFGVPLSYTCLPCLHFEMRRVVDWILAMPMSYSISDTSWYRI